MTTPIPTATVITTIQPPTPCVRALHDRLSAVNAKLYVVGDRKGPSSFALPGTTFLPFGDSSERRWRLSRSLPSGHYARKNLGYLQAIADGAERIYETDDDNAPNSTWELRDRQVAAEIAASSHWVNVYRCFSKEVIWPRGLPLESIHQPVELLAEGRRVVDAPIQQSLADLAPDVDAVWRLVFQRDFHFDDGPSVLLTRGSWCPFNSQSTWWWAEAFPLLYLPSHCSFRMTDIWRSFIAQRCLWEFAAGVVFHAAEVRQDRNEHSLTRDFEHEVPGYLRNEELVRQLESLVLTPGKEHVCDNLIRCYERLTECGFFPAEELALVRLWVDDIEAISGNSAGGEERMSSVPSERPHQLNEVRSLGKAS